jgi:hypothetical protein
MLPVRVTVSYYLSFVPYRRRRARENRHMLVVLPPSIVCTETSGPVALCDRRCSQAGPVFLFLDAWFLLLGDYLIGIFV